MLSILIPIYNYDVTKLVTELAQQCVKARIHFQILCFDDGSKDRYKKINEPISSIFGVSYLNFNENIGRSKIRNKLGFNAMYDNLLFLDCDSSIPFKKYIKQYVKYIDDYQIIYGGRRYKSNPPRSIKKILHWTYGVKKEALPAKKRTSKGNLSFQSNNFMIKRTLFLDNLFDEEITQYGHEDTLLAMELFKKNILIKHIDNPVEHKGLENTDVFLAKSSMAIENLLILEKQGHYIHTQLSSAATMLKKYRLESFFIKTYKKFEKLIVNNIHSKKPRMLFFSLFKLNKYLNFKGQIK